MILLNVVNEEKYNLEIKIIPSDRMYHKKSFICQVKIDFVKM